MDVRLQSGFGPVSVRLKSLKNQSPSGCPVGPSFFFARARAHVNPINITGPTGHE